MQRRFKLVLLTGLLGSQILLADPISLEEAVIIPEISKESSSWKHKLSLYGWLPSYSGRVIYTVPSLPERPGEPEDPGTPNETVSSKFIDKIDTIFMGSYEIQKGKWSFLLDGIYFKMSDSEENSISLPPIVDKDPIEVASEQELDLIFVNLYAGYNTIKIDNFTLDANSNNKFKNP